MSYQKGEIYFVRELERTGAVSPFVKIGLVHYRDKRNSHNRLSEHQTGNPRQLKLVPEQIVQTEAVDMVEAQLHRIFARKRVSGEWFEFDEEADVDAAVAKAKSLAAEVAELVPLFDRAAELKKVESNKKALPATPELLELARKNAVAKLQIDLCGDAAVELKRKLVAAVEAGEDITEVAGTNVRNFSPKFLESDFSAAHPDLYTEYLVQVSSWESRFLNKLKATKSDLDEEFATAFAEIEAAIADVADHSEISKLNVPNLNLTHLAGLATWNEAITQAQLKIALGEYDEITGVCSWKRYPKVTEKFDSRRFASENPELARQFVSTPVKKEYVQAKKTKA